MVRTLTTVARELRPMGHVVDVIGPDRFRTLPCPTYRDIPLALLPRRRMVRLIEAFRPDALHIATEGPLGWRRAAGEAHRSPSPRRSTRASPSICTHAPHVRSSGIRVAAPLPRRRAGHHGGDTVAARRLGGARLPQHQRGRAAWTSTCSAPNGASRNLARPIFLHVGRVAVEKNIGAFLDLDCPDRRSWSVTARPCRDCGGTIRGRWSPARSATRSARAYASADVFVFPSRTDTFGLVILEAFACGTPVAAFPVTGPVDVLADAAGRIGAVHANCASRARGAGRDRVACRAHAERYSWRACAEMFLSHLVPLAG